MNILKYSIGAISTGVFVNYIFTLNTKAKSK